MDRVLPRNHDAGDGKVVSRNDVQAYLGNLLDRVQSQSQGSYVYPADLDEAEDNGLRTEVA